MGFWMMKEVAFLSNGLVSLENILSDIRTKIGDRFLAAQEELSIELIYLHCYPLPTSIEFKPQARNMI